MTHDEKIESVMRHQFKISPAVEYLSWDWFGILWGTAKTQAWFIQFLRDTPAEWKTIIEPKIFTYALATWFMTPQDKS